MRFYNIFRYDFRYGFLSRPGKWTAVVLYGVFLFISFSFSLFHGFYGEVDSLWDINSLSLSRINKIEKRNSDMVSLLLFSVTE